MATERGRKIGFRISYQWWLYGDTKKPKFQEVDYCGLLLIIYYIWLCCFTTIKREGADKTSCVIMYQMIDVFMVFFT